MSIAVAWLGLSGWGSIAETPPVTPAASEGECGLPVRYLVRIARGHVPDRSEDVVIVPKEGNYLGSFDTTSHSGPWDYLQKVPLVWYGPGLEPRGRVDTPTTLADVYPTVGKLTSVSLESRTGSPLDEVTPGDGAGSPRLVVSVVWDGVGRNVLDRWPHAWPNLARLEREGISFLNTEVGSSPSITPSTHATFGTGTFPQRSGITGIQYRAGSDRIADSFAGRSPALMKPSTFADQIDLALGNEPKVGLVGWRSWHMGMLGHGAFLPGADRDTLALIGHRQHISGRRPEFKMPEYLRDFPGLQAHLDRADASDGTRDGGWYGHPVDADQDNPGWVAYQSDVLRRLISRGGYGSDDVPDLLFTNFKATDRVGHLYSMDSPEMETILRAQDAALGQLVTQLDEEVGDYVLIVTADHGHTPSARGAGSWPIGQRELEEDVDRFFDVPQGRSLTQAMTAVGLFVDRRLARDLGVRPDDIAAFLRTYSIRQNWPEKSLPAGYEDRGEETVLEAAFVSNRIDEALSCARRYAEAKV